ncbi:hypothetical protein NMY22_g16562 [Coprinellus aureogranulatus]|nr:hypothetical protein NMY22_g16562 [Coprinellus aureogranulatus]
MLLTQGCPVYTCYWSRGEPGLVFDSPALDVSSPTTRSDLYIRTARWIPVSGDAVNFSYNCEPGIEGVKYIGKLAVDTAEQDPAMTAIMGIPFNSMKSWSDEIAQVLKSHQILDDSPSALSAEPSSALKTILDSTS